MVKRKRSLESFLAEPVGRPPLIWDGFEKVSWRGFVARCNAACVHPAMLRCIVCGKLHECKADNPWPLWQHVLSKQGEGGHPSRGTVRRWEIEWEEDSARQAQCQPTYTAPTRRAAPWLLEAEERRTTSAVAARETFQRPRPKRKSNGRG